MGQEPATVLTLRSIIGLQADSPGATLNRSL
jgi:hypothetical protein